MFRPLSSLGVRREIYSRPPDWWAKYTWPMVMGIAVWTAIGAENIMKRWSREVEYPAGDGLSDAKPAERERELRPIHQRAVVSLAIVGFGTGLGILFLSGRSRIVKRIHGIFPPSVNPGKGNVVSSGEMTYLALETFGSFSGKEKIFPKELCQVIFPQKSNELRLKVQGDTVYWLGLDKAKVQGQLMSDTAAARDKLKELIESKRASKWKGGPLLRNK